jgi:hypothetical protein
MIWSELPPKRKIDGARKLLTEHHGTGHIYFVLAPQVRRVKIGHAYDIQKRLRDIRSFCPIELKVLHVFERKNQQTEKALHMLLDDVRLHGEWFEYTQDIREMLQQAGAEGLEKYPVVGEK